MLGRRLLPMVLAVIAVTAVTSPALAGKPINGPRVVGGGSPDDEPWIPPTIEQQESLNVRLAQAAALNAGSMQLKTTQSIESGFCPTSSHTAGVDAVTSTDCAPVSYTLATYARRQYNDFYCGPATAQVIINRSRGIYSSNVDPQNTSTNYKTQTYIASRLLWYNSALGRWENTNTAGQTNAYMLTNGLNELARLPSGFIFAVVPTGTGSEWHSKIITDTQQWHMAFGTAIKMTSTSPRLSSWQPISAGTEVHHWIPIRGYSGRWDGTNTPKVYYNDSSGQQGGGTGSYSDSSLKVYNLNHWHTARVVW
jgi:hypothetical protein